MRTKNGTSIFAEKFLALIYTGFREMMGERNRKRVATVVLLMMAVVGNVSAVIVKGKVIDQDKKAIAFASVAIRNSSSGTVSDAYGDFTLDLKRANQQLMVSCIGYESTTVEVSVGNVLSVITVVLKRSTTTINEVMVVEKSETTIAKEQPYSISVIDLKPLKTRNLDINQVLNTSAGIRIREEGGLGSNFKFSLNGFSGNQVKFFLDGLPMDNFGSSLSLNNIPVNLISKVEVYKGVVPIHLGADALGGAVNVITDSHIKNYIDASYSLGSFNTHRAAIISRFTNALLV